MLTKRGYSGRERALDEQIGARIRGRREALGMTQSQLGAALGLSFQQLQKYESGANRVSTSRLLTIAEVLQAPPSDFIPDGAAPPQASRRPDDVSRLTQLALMLDPSDLKLVTDLARRLSVRREA